jgi:hypothetical protein
MRYGATCDRPTAGGLVAYGGRIAVLPGQTAAEEFSTLVHELAHEMLHKAERKTATTKSASVDYSGSVLALNDPSASCPCDRDANNRAVWDIRRD